MSEENREVLRRRRRSETEQENDTDRETDMELPEAAGQAEPAEATGRAVPAEQIGRPEAESETVMPRREDSRIPPQARRMSAAPYGSGDGVIPRRPGTRNIQPARRIRENEAGSETVHASERGQTRQIPASRIQVGYAPGRMSGSDGTRTLPPVREVRESLAAQRPGSEMPRYRGPVRPIEEKPEPKKTGRHPVMRVLTAVLLLCGVVMIALNLLPKNNSLRVTAEELVRKATEPVEKMIREKPAGSIQIESFSVLGNEKVAAPVDVVFSFVAEKSVTDFRLVDEDGQVLDIVKDDLVSNAENNVWTLKLTVRSGYEGRVLLQGQRNGGDWLYTGDYSDLAVLAAAESDSEQPPIATQPPEEEKPQEEDPKTDEPTETESGIGDSDGDGNADAEIEDWDPEEESGNAEDEPGDTEDEPGDTEDEPGEAENEPEDTEDGTANMEEGDGEGTDGEEPEETDYPQDTEPPASEPEVSLTPEPTATPAPLTAQAAPGANPGLITQTTVYNGSKKVKDYNRPAKELIHMPTGWNYTPSMMGIFTFRGNAFRTNAAIGHVVSANGLSVLWETAAGSSRGASQTYYGYEWPGQPAIVKWSTQVRNGSNIDPDKQKKAPLYEVIIAGVDGVIRFLDLEDGTLTRGAINLGYPMKGTPSIHPVGAPYMTVGQFARKMKVKTGKIGLRQYNLYTQNELSLIDGLDGKLHRNLNDTGSFETSALIDWTSDTMITAGSNGLLYLISLNTSFDYNLNIFKHSPSTVVMASRTKAQAKNKTQIAVESSLAMYDRYVFYADMGGVLRCVDTNFLTTVWAVETGDAVMAAVALDMNGYDAVDLYTANMLANRKKGNVQIRKYDAMSGKELWTTEIGVQKDAKAKEKVDVGAKASPVIGEKGLSELVYFTVTGLSEEGSKALGTGEETKAAVIALEKDTGRVRWARGLSDRSESSPVAVYDADGKGWIIQCSEDGLILLLDGLTGNTVNELQVKGSIKASPAVYNNILVVGTTGKDTSYVYGINIH